MNKRQIVASLNKIANALDNNGLYSEANSVTNVMSRLAMDENDEYNTEDYYPFGDPDGDDEDEMPEEDDENYAFFEKYDDEKGEFAIVHYPGVFGKRKKVIADMKYLLRPGQPVVVDWDSNKIVRVKAVNEDELKFNSDIMRTKINEI